MCAGQSRAWLSEQVLPEDERLAVARHLREFDRLGEDLKVVERDLARCALADECRASDDHPGHRHGCGARAQGGHRRRGALRGPQKLVSYLGLNPSVRQSGPGRPIMGGSRSRDAGTPAGCWWAAWAAARAPVRCGPSFSGFAADRGQHVAAVATARKLAILIWHLLSKGELSVGASCPPRQEGAGPRAEGRPSGRPRPEGRRTPTTSKAIATRSDAGSSRPRRPMHAS